MTDPSGLDNDFIADQLDEALHEIRYGSLSAGISMIQATRDQLQDALDEPTDDDITDQEE